MQILDQAKHSKKINFFILISEILQDYCLLREYQKINHCIKNNLNFNVLEKALLEKEIIDKIFNENQEIPIVRIKSNVLKKENLKENNENLPSFKKKFSENIEEKNDSFEKKIGKSLFAGAFCNLYEYSGYYRIGYFSVSNQNQEKFKYYNFSKKSFLESKKELPKNIIFFNVL